MTKTMMTICIIAVSMGITFMGGKDKEGEVISRDSNLRSYGSEINEYVDELTDKGYDILSISIGEPMEYKENQYSAKYEITYYNREQNQIFTSDFWGHYDRSDGWMNEED